MRPPNPGDLVAQRILRDAADRAALFCFEEGIEDVTLEIRLHRVLLELAHHTMVAYATLWPSNFQDPDRCGA